MTDLLLPETILPSQMQPESHSLQSKKKYNLINDELRKMIVKRIEIDGKPLKEVSREFNIKLSTCKAILQVFQKEGRCEKKKKRIRKSKIEKNLNLKRAMSASSIETLSIINPRQPFTIRTMRKSFDESESEIKTNCSSKGSFSTYKKKVFEKPIHLVQMGDDLNHLEVLEGMWKEIFEYFGTKI